MSSLPSLSPSPPNRAMYWPNGVPRVYAVNGPGIPPAPSDEDRAVDPESSSSPEKNEAADHTDGPGSKPGSWADEPINGLCVSRSGHLFATMTESSIAVWQTKVCLTLSRYGVCMVYEVHLLITCLVIAYCCSCRCYSISVVAENIWAQCGPVDAPRFHDSRCSDP